MKKTIIIISVLILSYAIFWIIATKQSQGPITPLANTNLIDKTVNDPKMPGLNDELSQNQKNIQNNGQTLDLSNKGLSEVPSYVFTMSDISILDLSGNRLTGALPAEIRHLKNLRILDASDNQMTGIPAEIGQLSELESIDLSNNQITGLPLELANLKKLQVLDLSGNDYSEYDFGIIKQSLPDLVMFTE